MKLSTLQHEYHTLRDTYTESLRLRIHRTISWLNKAESAADEDTRFIALWIAFNAAYAREFDGTARPADRASFTEFLATICQLDQEGEIYRLVWQTFSGHIRLLLDNRYVFQPFWDYHNQLISQAAWEADFARAKQKALRALADKDTHAVLMAVFNRLYTLRNQILHGGATFGSTVNRTQLQDGCAFLSSLMPIVVQLMMHNSQEADWGRPFYPVIKEH